jgi:hypothetical protein
MKASFKYHNMVPLRNFQKVFHTEREDMQSVLQKFLDT